MLLPAQFSQTVADTFYDKTVTKLVKTTTSTDGWVTETGTTSSTFKANVQFNNLGAVQTELGLTEQVDVVMTCSTSEALAVNDLFSYDGVTYKVLAALPFDSHKRIVGSKWA